MRLLCLLAVLSLAGCSRKPMPVLGKVPEFELTSEASKPFPRPSLDGHVWVADFIFTNCEGPCPRMSSHMLAIQNQTPKDVKLVSFSVDPARDTPEALAQYAKKFKADPSRWSFLTGSPEVLNFVAHDVFKLSSVGAGLDHSTRFVLVDKKGRIRGYYGITDGDAVARVTADAKRLAQES